MSSNRTRLAHWIARTSAFGTVLWAGCSPASTNTVPHAAGSEAGAELDGSAQGDAATVDSGPVVAATVTVDPSSKMGKVAAGSVGLSYEKAHMQDGFLTGSNAPLVALLKLLGPSIFRIGANTVDETTWTPTGPGGTTGQIAKPDVDAFASLILASGWKALYGVNLETSTPALAADEATYAANALGSSLYGFEIGNEPDLYAPTSVQSWTYPSFKSVWESFAEAIRSAVPGAALTGPAAAFDYDDFTTPFASDEASTIALLTQHYYRDNGESASASISELLSFDGPLNSMLAVVDMAATKNAIPGGYRIAEANSFYNGGREGVSDTYASALWAIQFLFANARHGSAGANFHGGNVPGWYTPIADSDGAVTDVRPLFYGMLFFSLAGAGDLESADVGPSVGGPLSAFAIGAADGSTRVVLVNQDPGASFSVAIDLGTVATSANVLWLTGPSLSATSGVTLGGASITAAGEWTPEPPSSVPVNGSMISLNVPPESAALIEAK